VSGDPEEVPVHEGPDPRGWPGRQDIWPLAEDLRQADAMLELLDGKVARDVPAPAFEEARSLMRAITAECAGKLAVALLAAYGVTLPEEPAVPATEAVGGFSGDSDSTGDRDHLRRVRE
jgi:hypothetical protein